MMERPLMTADELKSIPKGHFVVMKTGMHPMRTRLRLFLEWGISFEEPFTVQKREHATIRYAGREELIAAIQTRYPSKVKSGAKKSDEAGISADTPASHVKT